MKYLAVIILFFLGFKSFSQNEVVDTEPVQAVVDENSEEIQGDLNLIEADEGQEEGAALEGPSSQEQELFDQLEVLNFEEAGFYEAYRSFIYSPSGRLSPFIKPKSLQNDEVFNEATPAKKIIGATGLKAYDLQALKVTSLIWDVDIPRALVLDPSGQSHRVEVGTKIGRNDGYVARIREGELIVIEKQKISGEDGKKEELFRTQVLKMAR